ncbi:uncharacterized protein [Anabrus simplex]|uniref:uncharacterized protein n=1 Tax=Anabrus simplex TaxID=316456 RepID=UPI0034DD9E0B
MAQSTTKCKECGWSCQSCVDQNNLHLHVEIENLKQRLLEREHHIATMETNFLAEAEKFPNGEYAALTEELLMWQDKYSRLYESYKRVQKVNQNLEDKLLKIVDKCETEKNSLLKEVSSLNQRLMDARGKGNRLQSENERYRNDVNLAIQLLQCKPTNFVSQKYDSLPADLQQKVLSYICGKRRTSDGSAVPIRLEMRTIKVPVSTSPPSSMVYSVNKTDVVGENEECEELLCEGTRPPIDSVSAAIMAKVLEERERERLQMKHCETCTCSSPVAATTNDRATQTTDELSRAVTEVTNRASQGLVRYVDIVTTRNADSVPHNRLGIRISDSATRNITRSAIKSSESLDSQNNSVQAGYQDEKGFNENSEMFNNGSNISDELSVESDSSKVKNGESHDSLRITGGGISPGSSKESCIIDVEVSADGRSDIPSSTRSREILSARNNNDTQNKVSCYHTKTSSEGSIMKIKNREGRSFLADNCNSRTASAWVRYPSDPNKKSTLITAVAPNEKPISQVPFPTLVKPTETSISRLPFSSTGRSRERSSDNLGPRLCSMRVQAGTSNILLDNATSYEPILYTSRHSQQDGVLVHAPRSRSTSASSMDDVHHKQVVLTQSVRSQAK